MKAKKNIEQSFFHITNWYKNRKYSYTSDHFRYLFCEIQMRTRFVLRTIRFHWLKWPVKKIFNAIEDVGVRST